MAFDVDLAGLEASGCKTEVCGNRTRMLEACGIIDACLVGQCSDKANPGCTHQALTDHIGVGHMTSAVIQFTEAVIKYQAGIQQWQSRFGQCHIGLDDVTHRGIERTVTELGRQLDTEHLEQAPDLVFQVDAFTQYCFATG